MTKYVVNQRILKTKISVLLFKGDYLCLWSFSLDTRLSTRNSSGKDLDLSNWGVTHDQFVVLITSTFSLQSWYQQGQVYEAKPAQEHNTVIQPVLGPRPLALVSSKLNTGPLFPPQSNILPRNCSKIVGVTFIIMAWKPYELGESHSHILMWSRRFLWGGKWENRFISYKTNFISDFSHNRMKQLVHHCLAIHIFNINHIFVHSLFICLFNFLKVMKECLS